MHMETNGKVVRRRLRVQGVVQGVGFRPFVYRLAHEHGLAGWVRNTSQGVEIEVEGPAPAVNAFGRALTTEAPPLARLDSVDSGPVPVTGEGEFRILASQAAEDVEAMIPADVATCAACAGEIFDPADRRHGYPFTNCTDCGPRFTIIAAVPYDRRFTTMRGFRMCPQCQAEYDDPRDRRFHAEPNACPVCGPRLWLEEDGERREDGVLARAGELLAAGLVVAVKGIGGFHLACDARQEAAVQLLRARKGRGDKPLAVMVRDLAEARGLAVLEGPQEALLASPAAPIVLARKRPGSDLAPGVAPGNRDVGLMLPYSPLHRLLFNSSPPALVMTSGNVSEEPLAYTIAGAREKLTRLADALVLHNRDIQVPCDDSVLRVLPPGETIILRRARGLVPHTISLPVECPADILGVGGEQKNTFCLAWGRTALLSQHIGDLDTVETYDYFGTAIAHLEGLSRRTHRVIAHDLHPGYLSTRYARDREGDRHIGVQHHHAHIAACLAENGSTERCLGLALDGTGYGTDGTIWGGEILLADLADFQRVGHLAPVRLPGGEAAVRDPRRMAAAYLHAAYGGRWAEMAAPLGLGFTPLEAQVLERQLASGWNSPLTSSAGRLFDAVAAALDICRRRSYEGQPAVELEMAAAEDEGGFYRASVQEQEGRWVLDGPGLFRQVLDEYLAGVSRAVVAARFHESLARLLGSACEHLRQRHGLNLVALSGGVFQNARMALRVKELLREAGFEVLTHTQSPPNDGCVALGQAVVAAARLGREAKGEGNKGKGE